MYDFIPDNQYILLTPGPLSTSKGVRNALLNDWCTWDDDYNKEIVQNIRRRITEIAVKDKIQDYTTVLMQGSGSFGVEACIGSAVSKSGKILILTNGAYGDRMVKMCQVMNINFKCISFDETRVVNTEKVKDELEKDDKITHVSVVHCETTTGILNNIKDIAETVKNYKKIMIVDAMSSFGGIPIDMHELKIDYLISSSNKCIQGVPGFSFIIAKKSELLKCKGNSCSFSLDLYDQWNTMKDSGKWRFTSPTHVVRAFYQALNELEEEGGVQKRYERYLNNHVILTEGMRTIGFKTLLPDEIQSPIITSFYYPYNDFNFKEFYTEVKKRGFVLYPGKISNADTFRIGNIGEVYADDIKKLIRTIQEVIQ